MKLALDSLRSAYESGTKPSDVVEDVYTRIETEGMRPVWISLVPRARALKRAQDLLTNDRRSLPLYGVPFAVKDNIDAAGMETTAGCPAFAYRPNHSATVVRRLEEAGAILIGKTNMDQFATGLVGVRSPYGACSSVFSSEHISGGSSSGSAVVVAKGLVSFSLGTDTAGSGRVPAAFNNLVGLKPTRGAISTSGVIPACRSLDCISIFAATCGDTKSIFEQARGFDAADSYSRCWKEAAGLWLGNAPRFGVPHESQLEFFGDEAARDLYFESIGALEDLGGRRVEIDLTPFRAAADLLYAGPWVAERLAAIESFFAEHAEEIDPVVRGIISGGTKYSAVDCFNAQYRLSELRRETSDILKTVDFLLLPTSPTTYKIAEVDADPIRLNSNLGYYTNFVNLLDLAAVALPAGFRPNGLPFGVSLIGPKFSDTALLYSADQLHGLLMNSVASLAAPSTPPGFTLITVVGAHLAGQPLNYQLTSRGACLLKTTRTAACYRLYALDGSVPPKPGLIRDPGFHGGGIEVEVWAIPMTRFGSFVSLVVAPLGIGSLELMDGTWVQGFICEPYAAQNAREITQLGGWRAYLNSSSRTD